MGAAVQCSDSWVDPDRFPLFTERVELTPDIVAAADLVVMLTNHHDFDLEMIQTNAKAIFDTRNTMSGPTVTRL